MLNDRQKRFVETYLGAAQGNATVAAKLAGYSAKTAGQIGGRLLKNVQIRKALEKAQQAREAKAIAAADERDRILTEIARSNVEPKDRIKAIDLLNKCEGRYSATLHVKGKLTLEQALGRANEAIAKGDA